MNQEERKQYKVLISKVKALYSIVHDSVTDTTTSEIGRYSSCKNMAIRYNQLASEAEMLTGHKIETFNINVIKDPGDMLWTTQKTIMEEVAVSAQFLIAQLSSEEEFAEDEICNLENFILSRLRAVVFTKPEKEKQVQDAVEALFIGNGWQKGIDYNRESGKNDKFIHKVVSTIVRDTISAAISAKNGERKEGTPKYKFLPVFECKYSDGIPMYTCAVIIFSDGDEDDEDFPEKRLGINDWYPKDDIYEITVPALTYRELNAINQMLPWASTEEIKMRFPFIPEKTIKQYVSIWKYYPHFFETGDFV